MFFKTFLLALFFPFLFSGCVVGFSNAQNHIPIIYSKIYVPSANDSSIYSGNSSRLSAAVREVLAHRTDIELTPLSKARLALQIQILDRVQSIVAVDSCQNPGTPYVASFAYSCSFIHPELTNSNPNLLAPTSFNQPSISPNSENIYLVVDAKAVDLNTGHILWAKHYYANNIPVVVFNEIGDTDNRTSSNMANKPQMHGLRYQEAIDNAVQSFSNAIAADLQNSLFSSLSKN